MKITAIVAMAVIALVAFFWAVDRGEIRGEEMRDKAKMEALAYAKQGWFYNCGGWQCRWEKIK